VLKKKRKRFQPSRPTLSPSPHFFPFPAGPLPFLFLRPGPSRPSPPAATDRGAPPVGVVLLPWPSGTPLSPAAPRLAGLPLARTPRRSAPPLYKRRTAPWEPFSYPRRRPLPQTLARVAIGAADLGLDADPPLRLLSSTSSP